MGALQLGRVAFLVVVAFGVIACSSADPEEDTGSTAEDLSSGPASKVVCGADNRCGPGYTAVQPLCISTCGGCNPYGRNAYQCAKNRGGSGVSSTVTCGFACPVGLRAVEHMCVSTCGGCNPYGANAVHCAR